MRVYLLILCFFSFGKAFSQIDIIETKEKEYSKPPNYDSSYNFGSFKSIMRLTGQTIYFIPLSKKYNNNGSSYLKENKYSQYVEFLTKYSTKVRKPKIDPQFDHHTFMPLKRNDSEYDREKDSMYVNIYKPVNIDYNFLTPLDSIEGRYFNIRGVIENPKLADKLRHDGTYFELVAKINTSDSLLFKLDSRDSKFPEYTFLGNSDSYLIQGYYEKLKRQFLNKKYFLTKNIPSVWDINTGKIIDLNTTNKEWICNSLTLIETRSNKYLQLSLVLKNGDKTIAVNNGSGGLFAADAWETISLLNFKTEEQVLLEKMQADEIETRRKEATLIALEEQKRLLLEKRQFESEMIKKYGAIVGKLILNNKVVIGMSKEICKFSWGDPYDINRTITKNKNFEQWVYSMGTYLYFENDILVAIQD